MDDGPGNRRHPAGAPLRGQPSLFDLTEARRRRDEALDAVAAAAPQEWRERAYETVCAVASRQAYFAADDIWAAGLEKPHEPRALGPVMMRAVKEGVCEATAYTQHSKSVTQHSQPIRVYRSLSNHNPREGIKAEAAPSCERTSATSDKEHGIDE